MFVCFLEFELNIVLIPNTNHKMYIQRNRNMPTHLPSSQCFNIMTSILRSSFEKWSQYFQGCTRDNIGRGYIIDRVNFAPTGLELFLKAFSSHQTSSEWLVAGVKNIAVRDSNGENMHPIPVVRSAQDGRLVLEFGFDFCSAELEIPFSRWQKSRRKRSRCALIIMRIMMLHGDNVWVGAFVLIPSSPE